MEIAGILLVLILISGCQNGVLLFEGETSQAEPEITVYINGTKETRKMKKIILLW